MYSALLENKAVLRSREKQEDAQRKKKTKDEERQKSNNAAPGRCEEIKEFCGEMGAAIQRKTQYLVMPIVKLLPSVLFRLASLWLILCCSAELYPNKEGNGPGWLLVLPSVFLGIIVVLNFLVATKTEIDLKKEEAILNANCNILLPAYSDLFFEVSISLRNFYCKPIIYAIA